MKVSFAKGTLRVVIDSRGDEHADGLDGFDGSADLSSLASDFNGISSPTYWQSPSGKNAIKSLPPVAPPLDFRQLEWSNQMELNEEKLRQQELDDLADFEDNSQVGRMASTAYPAVGSALQAARRSNNNNNRAVTAPE